jgi:deoxyribonuclease-4
VPVGQELRQDLLVARGALDLRQRALVEVQLEPGERLEDLGDVLRRGALAVGVLDAQDERAARVTGHEPVVERGAGTADVQGPGGARGEADAHGQDSRTGGPARGRACRRGLCEAPGMLIGAHVSPAGGPAKAVERGRERGARSIQIFNQNPRAWKPTEYADDAVAAYEEARSGSGVDAVLIHAIYLLNPASEDPEIRDKTRTALVSALRAGRPPRCPGGRAASGSAKAGHVGEAVARAGALIREALDESDACPLHLENTAGAGGTLGRSFAELGALVDAAGGGERLGLCLDSCHLFASGYDIRTAEGLTDTLDECDREIGLDRLGSLHLNDSQVGLASNRDRHAPVGFGELGEEGCAVFLSEPRFDGLPCVLETPGEKSKDGPTAAELAFCASAAPPRGARRQGGDSGLRPRRRPSDAGCARPPPGEHRRDLRDRQASLVLGHLFTPWPDSRRTSGPPGPLVVVVGRPRLDRDGLRHVAGLVLRCLLLDGRRAGRRRGRAQDVLELGAQRRRRVHAELGAEGQEARALRGVQGQDDVRRAGVAREGVLEVVDDRPGQQPRVGAQAHGLGARRQLGRLLASVVDLCGRRPERIDLLGDEADALVAVVDLAPDEHDVVHLGLELRQGLGEHEDLDGALEVVERGEHHGVPGLRPDLLALGDDPARGHPVAVLAARQLGQAPVDLRVQRLADLLERVGREEDPMASFSSASSSDCSYSSPGMGGREGANAAGAPPPGSPPRSKIEPWPICASSWAFCPAPCACSSTDSIPLREAPVQSNAPHLTSASIAFLFTARGSTRAQKSHRSSNGPPSRGRP